MASLLCVRTLASPGLRQSWTSSGIIIHMIGVGTMLSYPSSLLPGLQNPESDIKVDLDTASWLASLNGITSILGFVYSSIVMQWFGRRIALLAGIFPSIVSWLLLYVAPNVGALIAGRALGGISGGATVTLGAIAIGEYSSPKYRGIFLGLKTTAVCLGGMICHILANYFHWRTVALVTLIPHTLSFIIVLLSSESPAWFVSKNRFADGERSFFLLRGKNEETQLELDDLLRAQKERMSQFTGKRSVLQNMAVFFGKFKRKDFVLPTVIIIFTSITLESGGRHVFPAYAPDIMIRITGSNTRSFYYTLCIDLITTLSSFFSSYLMKIMKRRTLLFSTGGLALIALFIACVYLLLASRDIISKDRTWIPLFLFITFFVIVNLGVTPIPLAILGEIYPLVHKGAGTIVSGLVMSVTLMVTLKITPVMLVKIDVYGTFFVFGGALVVSLVVLYFIIPETKDKTLQEIEDYFTYGKFVDTKIRNDDVKAKMISADNV